MKRYVWPQCTQAGCTCVRSWATEDEARHAAGEHLEEWVDHATGRAICRCHTSSPRPDKFPCDVWLARNLPSPVDRRVVPRLDD